MSRNFLTWQVNGTLATYWSVGEEADLVMPSDVFELFYPTLPPSPLVTASTADIMLRDTVQQVAQR